jgi:hypothetical protein
MTKLINAIMFLSSLPSSDEGQEKKKTWIGLIDESVHTSDDIDIGDIDAVSKDFVVVKRGFVTPLLFISYKQSKRMG